MIKKNWTSSALMGVLLTSTFLTTATPRISYATESDKQACRNDLESSDLQKIAALFAEALAPGASPSKLKESFNYRILSRVLRGTTPQDFKSLYSDPNRKVIFFAGPRSVRSQIGLTRDQLLHQVGFTPESIAILKAKQVKFVMLLTADFGSVLRAKWKNTSAIFRPLSTEVANTIDRQLPELIKYRKNFPQELKRLDEIFNRGRGDPEFMSLEKYLALSPDQRTVHATRALLYHEGNFNRLFRGNGLTYSEDGRRGASEYFALNVPIASLRNSIFVDIGDGHPEVAAP